jgi:hypothetical protein
MVRLRGGDLDDAIKWADLHWGANVLQGDKRAAAFWISVKSHLVRTKKTSENPVYQVPKAVRDEAANGLAMREWRSQSTKRPGGTAVGVARAEQLVRGTIDDWGVRRMKAFFDRFKYLKKHPDWGLPTMPGYVAWTLWGGDPGYEWVKKILERRS